MGHLCNRCKLNKKVVRSTFPFKEWLCDRCWFSRLKDPVKVMHRTNKKIKSTI